MCIYFILLINNELDTVVCDTNFTLFPFEIFHDFTYMLFQCFVEKDLRGKKGIQNMGLNTIGGRKM